MEPTRINELVAQVVAWHNRHRLARRITSAQVRSIGVVVLPFVSTDAPEAAAGRLVPAFSEDFIAPLTPKQVAHFAARHGSREHPGAPGWSERVVPADAAHDASAIALLYLRTASIELGDHRCRVLIGAEPRAQTLGPRAWSAPRIAGASAALTSIVAAAVVSLLLAGTPEPLQARAHPVPAAAPASAVDSVAVSENVVAAAASPASQPAVLEVAPTPASAPPVPADAPSHRPEVRPTLSPEERATALLEGRRLRALAPATQAASRAPETARIYAVMTPATRTRAASERGHQVMTASASTGQWPGPPHGELMQAADGWRAVLWPFRTRTEANLARVMLLQRGIRTEVLEF